MDASDDKELLELLKQGSLDAYEMLFRKYYKLVCLQATLFLTDEAEAEDLVIELFTEIWDKKIYRRIENSFKAYIYRAVRNRCLNVLKKREITRQQQKKYRESRNWDREPAWLDQRELAAGINDALIEFPTQRLRAFTLVYLEEKRYQEVASEMGLSINSVKTHLRLALQVLRNKLEKFR